MRKDTNKKPFEYYLSMIEPNHQDIEIPEKALIEMEVICQEKLFCFHIPKRKTAEWDIDVKSLPKKVWVSGKEFHRKRFNQFKEEVQELMEKLMV